MGAVHKLDDHRQFQRVPQGVEIPTDPEAERGLIGAVVESDTRDTEGRPDIVAAVGGPSLTEDFNNPELKAIWGLICERHLANLPNDVVSLFDCMRERGMKLNGVRQGDLSAWAIDFSELVVGFPGLAERYASQLREAATRRRAIMHAWSLIQRCGGEDKRPLGEWYTDAATPLTDLAVPVTQGVPLSEHVLEVLRHVEQLAERKISRRPGLPTGIAGIDALTGGFRNGHLIIVGARPSIGKTSLGIGAAIAIARHVGPVALISAEMPGKECAERIMSQVSGVELSRLWRGPIGQIECPKIVAAAAQASHLPIRVDDDVRDWPAVMGRLQQRVAQGCRAVIVDYLGLMRVPGSEPGWEKIATVTHDAKDFAKRHNVPFIMLAQLNRQAADPSKAPTMSELRGGGDIEQDADVIILIHRPKAHDPENDDGNADLILEKQRGGPTGVVAVRWHKLTAEFRDLDPGYSERDYEDGRYGS